MNATIPAQTPEAVHARAAALRRVIRTIEDGRYLPWNGRIAQHFADRDDLLMALHEHWSRQLLARIDVALELGEGTQQESVARAWTSAVRDQPGVRKVLDAERDNPALRASWRSLLASVAVAAGLATFDDPVASSVAAGESFLARVDAARGRAPRGPSLLSRALRRVWDGGPPADRWPWAT